MNKKIISALIALTVTCNLTPANVSAASNVYVPTVGKATVKDGSNVDSFTISQTFDSNGKITKYVENWPTRKWKSTRTYKWNKNLLSSIKTVVGEDTSNETHSYTAGRETKYYVVQSDGSQYDTDYNWTGNTASVTQNVKKSSGSTYVIAGTRTIDSSKRIASETYLVGNKTSKVTYKYYKTGLRKSSVRSGNLKVNGYTQADFNYNKNGYMTSSKLTYPDGKVQKTTLKYTMDKKKNCPKKIVKTETYDGTTKTTTYTFTKFKKVKRVRNCDDSGNVVPLGANY